MQCIKKGFASYLSCFLISNQIIPFTLVVKVSCLLISIQIIPFVHIVKGNLRGDYNEIFIFIRQVKIPRKLWNDVPASTNHIIDIKSININLHLIIKIINYTRSKSLSSWINKNSRINYTSINIRGTFIKLLPPVGGGQNTPTVPCVSNEETKRVSRWRRIYSVRLRRPHV